MCGFDLCAHTFPHLLAIPLDCICCIRGQKGSLICLCSPLRLFTEAAQSLLWPWPFVGGWSPAGTCYTRSIKKKHLAVPHCPGQQCVNRSRVTWPRWEEPECYKSETQTFTWILYDHVVFDVLVQICPQSRFISFCSELSNPVAPMLTIL